MTYSATSRALPGSAHAGIRIPDRTLPLIRDLVHDRTGLHYDDGRLDVIADRLTPLAAARGFDSLLDYYYLLKYDEQADEEWVRAIDALSVRETYFWREFDQVRALTDAIMPRAGAAASPRDPHLEHPVRDRRGTAVHRHGADRIWLVRPRAD